jgi:hypothetical protein
MSDRRTRTAVRSTAGALLLGLVLTGCSDEPADRSGGTPSATPTPTPTPTPAPTPAPRATEAPRPEDGACHRLDVDEALAPTAGLGAVGCRTAHTSQTYAVGRVDHVVDGHLLAVDSVQVQRQVATVCPEALPEAVGGSLVDVRLSMLRAVWFTPTVEESDAGADWYRCDVVAVAGPERLIEVRGSLAGALEESGADAYAMCGTAGPDDDGFERVACSERHTWRAVDVVDLADLAGERAGYPGRRAVTGAGQTPCEDAGAAVAEDALDYEWAYEAPDREQWEAGQTFGRCWAPDAG